MKFRTALYTITFEDLRNYIVYPLVQCKAEPLAEFHVVKLADLLLNWDTVYGVKLALDDKASEAQARVNNASVRLNNVASRVAKAILTITGDNRDEPLYLAYIGDKTLSEFKRSFNEKLTVMRGWIPHLKASEYPSLVALAEEVEQAVAIADAAVTMRLDVRAQKKHFRNDGDRKKLIDKVNIVCKSIHGELAGLPHEMAGLPHDFADRFFLSESHPDDDEEETEEADTIDQAKAKVTAAKKQLVAAEEHLKEVVAEKAAADAAAAVFEGEKAALAALEAEIAEKAAVAAALRAKLKKGPVV